MSKIFYIIAFSCFVSALIVFIGVAFASAGHSPWDFRSIDTMKYSRDLSRAEMNDPLFDTVINRQVADIAKTGANYVAVDTPYDTEFLPMLRRWVSAARRYKLHIWFRGNFSGWEQWFGYPRIDPATHTEQIQEFIHGNKDLFQDGDVFTSCPECENGWKPNLESQKDLSIYRAFLIAEYQMASKAFKEINKHVIANYYSMNKNAAEAVMDRNTLKALDGVIVIDHYVASPEKLAQDVSSLAERTHADVVLGEFGAPIPDLNGNLSDIQQAAWIDKALSGLSQIPQLKGVNYWVNTGGSTGIWTPDGAEKPAVASLSAYYKGRVLPASTIPARSSKKNQEKNSFFAQIQRFFEILFTKLQIHFYL